MYIDKVKRISSPSANAFEGVVVYSPVKSVWITSCLILTLVFAPFCINTYNIVLFLISTAIVLCFGHSLGMHRKLIHNSYDCPVWLEYLFVYLGVLVGLSGPKGMIKTHDTRDWAQRQALCHPYFSHKSYWLKDAWWQLHCDIVLTNPPSITFEERVLKSKFYTFLDKTWILQQFPMFALLYYFGGIDAFIWGGTARVSACVIGHWLVGFFAHNKGGMRYYVNGASTQGYNVGLLGINGFLTMGECWHNNHHAYPGSAKIGLHRGEVDPGYWVLKLLEKVRLVRNIKLPQDLEKRENLVVLQ